MEEQDKIKEQISRLGTERDGGDRLKEYLAKLGDCLLSLGGASDENINRLVALCGEFMGATCALYNRLEKDMLYSAGKWNVPQDFKPFDNPQGHICYDVILRADNEPLVVRDLQHSSYAKTDPNVTAYKLETYIGLAVKFNKNHAGSLCVVFQKDFTPSDEEIRFMRIVASAIAVEESHRQAEFILQETRERDKLICDTATDYVFTVRIKDGRPVETNHGPTCVTVTGYSPEEFNADPDLWIKMVHEEDRPLVSKQAALILSGERASPFEHRIIRKDGSLRWVKNTTALHFDKKGKLLSYTGLIQDITEQMNTYEALRQRERFLTNVFSGIQDGVSILDKEMRIIRVNSAMEKWYAHAMPLVGKRCYEAYHLSSEPCNICPVLETLKTGKTSHKIVPKTGPEGIIGWLDLYSFPFKDEESGKIEGIIEYVRDITERKKAEDGLRHSEEAYRTLVNNLNIGVYRDTVEAEGTFINANPAMARIFGYDCVEEILKIKVADLYQYPQDRVRFMERIRNAGVVKEEELRFKKKDGTFIWAAVTARINFDSKGNPVWIDGVIEDITERKQIEEKLKDSEARFRNIFASAKDGILLADIETKRFIMSNKMIRDMLGYTEEEIKGLFVNDIHPEKDVAYIIGQFERQARGEIESLPNAPVKRKDGSIFYADINTTVITLANKKYLMGNFRDITERKEAEEEVGLLNKELLRSNKRLKQLALRDPQTGLYNHRYLQDVIEAEFFRAKRYNHSFSVMMMDVDYFKSINDVYGHIFGDLVLKQLARHLKMLVRQYDIVIRFGGEEFVIISPGIDRLDAIKLAERLLDTINLYNFGDKNHMVKLKLSIAVTSYPEDKIVKGMDLVEIADQVLDKLKERGGNNVYSSLDIKKKRPAAPGRPKIDVGLLKEKILKLTRQTNQSLIEAVFAFAKTIEVKDQYTGEHVEMTVQYATEIARALNLEDEEIERIKQAAILHDLGKIGISEKILAKKSKLTREEFEEIKRHPQIGVDIIRPIKFLHNIIPIMLSHHERWDGKGYPNGLKGDEIPIGARVVAIADVYQALTSNRPYRKAYSIEEAVKIIRGGSGSQFDPKVVGKFTQLIRQIDKK